MGWLLCPRSGLSEGRGLFWLPSAYRSIVDFLSFLFLQVSSFWSPLVLHSILIFALSIYRRKVKTNKSKLIGQEYPDCLLTTNQHHSSIQGNLPSISYSSVQLKNQKTVSSLLFKHHQLREKSSHHQSFRGRYI